MSFGTSGVATMARPPHITTSNFVLPSVKRVKNTTVKFSRKTCKEDGRDWAYLNVTVNWHTRKLDHHPMQCIILLPCHVCMGSIKC